MRDSAPSSLEAGAAPVAVPAQPSAPRWLIAAGVAIAAATALGAAFAPYLLVHHPLWLLALNPWPRHQLLVAPDAALLPFIAVVVVRGMLSCAVALEIGRHYGTRGVALIEGRSIESGRMLRSVEKLFGRFSYAFLLLTPGWFTSALAGMSGVARARCLALNSIGLTGWGLVHYRLGAWLEPWTAPIVRFLQDNVLVATAVCVLLVAVYQGHAWRKRSLSVLHKPNADETPR
jgi:membrane protein DedA with SNARE-associated domain